MAEFQTARLERGRLDDRAVERKLPATLHDLWLAGAYFVVAVMSLALTRFEGGIALSWLASGLLLPRLASAHPLEWARPMAFCAIASMFASILFGVSAMAAPAFAAVLMFEAAFGAALLRRFIPDGRYFDTIPRVGMFVGLIGLVMPAASALAGGAVAHLAMSVDYWITVRNWALVHSLGALVCMPIVSLLTGKSTHARMLAMKLRWKRLDWALLLSAVAVPVLVFGQNRFPLLFLPMLPVTFLTLRHGRIGASLSLIVVAVVGTVLTSLGFGPLTAFDHGPYEKMLLLQLYLAACVVTALPMAGELNRRRYLMDRLRASEALFRLMADRSGDILFSISTDGIIRYVSPSVSSIGGYTPAQLQGTASIALVAEPDRPLVGRMHRRALNRPEDTFIFEYRARTAEGPYVWFETHTKAMLDDDGKVVGVVSAVRDVSHRKRREAQLSKTANTDPLTGLGNRRLFEVRLDRAIARSRRLHSASCLVVADIDHFKTINDRHGHPVGDEVLRQFSTRLTQALGDAVTPCRIGGEEFGFILSDIAMADAGRVCTEIGATIAATPIQSGSTEVALTMSMGLAIIDDHSNAVDLMRRVDQALYAAKEAGRNCIRIAI